ncbi:hypothetical protein [Pseudodesulfovibrio methanolicus]|uniref:DUF2269 family protein n=1 Tax=Pseudodesulfovibrio methanolicus TaxID=3126690 RepID=A0ABZ2IT58_9BACT
MLKLGPGGRKWLKGLHLCTVACWVGGGVALILLYFLKSGVTDGGVLYGMNRAIHHVDSYVVVIPGAFGCLLTGLAYSLFTGFGFVKHGWVILKWAVTVSAIAFGTVCLGPWERAMMDISGRLGAGALSDAAYLHNERMNFIWGLVQVAVLAATVFVSVFKPWKNLLKKSA